MNNYTGVVNDNFEHFTPEAMKAIAGSEWDAEVRASERAEKKERRRQLKASGLSDRQVRETIRLERIQAKLAAEAVLLQELADIEAARSKELNERINSRAGEA